MAVHPSGYCAWKAEPMSPRGKDGQRQLGLLKHAWPESGGVRGDRKLTMDMRDLGETCGKHRVARRSSSRDYAPRRATADGLGVAVANLPWSPQSPAATLHCQRAQPVLGHRHHRHPHHEDWLHLSVVIDLFSRRVIGWSMGHRIDTELALNALLMVLWRCQPKATVTVRRTCAQCSPEFLRVNKGAPEIALARKARLLETPVRAPAFDRPAPAPAGAGAGAP